MTKTSLFFFFILISNTFTAIFAEETQLIYLPNDTVILQSIFTADLDQTLPNLELKSTIHQELEASLYLTDPSHLPIAEGPIEMVFKLTDLKVNLQANDITTTYNAKKPDTSLFLAEIKDILNRPLHIHFDRGFHIRPETPGLQQLAKELPILSNIHPQSFAEELFQHLFSLAGKKLNIGESYTIVGDIETPDMPPYIITYHITSIDEDRVTARLSGSIKHNSTPLKTAVRAPDKTKTTALLKLKGEIEGEVSWLRKNALIHEMRMRTVYQGSINLNSPAVWPIRLELNHTLSSKKLTDAK